ncbi:hypothetical protein QAD02_001380 [Eretmocerus hayati]|uniref:Uncharacterized protein n=1 Tax=Eretmocerus hayati TaxID=131215 RepID=A0ACC2NHM3_9HYME|nr:hypothetical protein QAD02_001380 [Eretmocerus hayati]
MAVRGFEKLVFLAVLLLGVVITLSQAQDVDQLLKNKQLVDREIACVLQRKPCDVVGKQIKALIPEALHNGCQRCKPQDRVNSKKLIAFMQKNYPSEFRALHQLYPKN